MLEGGCYCGALRYGAGGKPILKALCHCRECQYISGGGANYFMLMPKDEFHYTNGAPKLFTRDDLDVPATREFCATCGTHILSRLPGRPHVVIKIGTLDDPARFRAPAIAIHTADIQPFHILPEGLPTFERLPPGA